MFTNRFFHLVIVPALIVVLALPAQAAGSAQAETFHFHVPAAAEIWVSTCPFGDWLPETDTVCEDWQTLYYREAEPPDLREAPWNLWVVHVAVIVHPDGTVTELFFTEGLLENPQGSFDVKKYTYAQVSGTVPMSDGSQVAVDLTWDMALAELYHGGNNSIFNLNNGIDPHYNDRCLTLIQLAHQQWRTGPPGQISGSIGGMDIHSFILRPDHPFIAGRSIYTYVRAEHGGCAP